MDQTASIQDRFGPAAAAYVTSAVHRSGPDLDALLAAGVRTGHERVLDLGCGPGHTALAFAPRVAEAVGLDLTPAMLDAARAQAMERGISNARFEPGNAEALPFPDASFDVVTSRHSAHHVADPAAMLREVARVLVPGGLFLLSDAVAPDDAASDTFLNAFEVLRDPSHVRDHREADWQALLATAGLASEVLDRFVLEIDFEAWVTRIGTSAEATAGLRVLFDAAPAEVRARFGLERPGDYDFQLPIAVLRAEPQA
ncbi:MAG: methyltransferase domain-containing protein [Myxococcota bacterium]